jgi:uncharacterized protein (TIGR01777 family)
MTTGVTTAGAEKKFAAITGSTGLIGRVLVPELARAGYACRRLVRRAALSEDEVEWSPDRGALDPAGLEGVDVVIHLAGENIAQRWTAARRRRILESRVNGTSLLVKTMAKLRRPPGVFVGVSAIGIYGDRGDEQLDESSRHGSDFLATVSDAWEGAAAPVTALGTRLATPRLGVVLSCDGGALARLLPFFQLGVGGRLGSGRQWMSWVSISDVVRALLFTVATPSVSGPLNVVAPNPVDNAEFARVLARVLRRPALFPVPAIALALAFGDMAAGTILASQRVRPRALLQAGFEFAYPTLESALRAELGRRE